MKWIDLTKAKVKFGVLYLISSPDLERPCCGTLKEIKETEEGIKHSFLLDVETEHPPVVTHVAIVTKP